MLTRPAGYEAKAEARKSEDEAEATMYEAEADTLENNSVCMSMKTKILVGTNLIHGEKCVISQDASENMPNFTEYSRAPQTLFRGAMLMQTKKSVE